MVEWGWGTPLRYDDQISIFLTPMEQALRRQQWCTSADAAANFH